MGAKGPRGCAGTLGRDGGGASGEGRDVRTEGATGHWAEGQRGRLD